MAIDRLEEHDKRFQPPNTHDPHHLERETTKNTHRPRTDESLKDQNSALREFIERTERELEKEKRNGTHNRR